MFTVQYELKMYIKFGLVLVFRGLKQGLSILSLYGSVKRLCNFQGPFPYTCVCEEATKKTEEKLISGHIHACSVDFRQELCIRQ